MLKELTKPARLPHKPADAGQGREYRNEPLQGQAYEAPPGERRLGLVVKPPHREPPRPAKPYLLTDGRPQPFAITEREKILFPEVGLTKGGVLDYYQKISPWLLPYLKNRPVTVERLPEGLVGRNPPHFWQKSTPAHYPRWIPRFVMPAADGKLVRYALVNDVETLLYLVNQGAITFHVSFSTFNELDHPDFVLFDLDPGRSDFAHCVTVAKKIRSLLDRMKIGSTVKTSGKSGLHIVAPWAHAGGCEQSRRWAMQIAHRACDELPEMATMRLARTPGRRVLVDVPRNAPGYHAVPPYVLRATPRATVSTPLDWDDLSERLDPSRLGIRAVFKRLGK
jgi:bifunctional non-homologous end joining protein LigD